MNYSQLKNKIVELKLLGKNSLALLPFQNEIEFCFLCEYQSKTILTLVKIEGTKVLKFLMKSVEF